MSAFASVGLIYAALSITSTAPNFPKGLDPLLKRWMLWRFSFVEDA
jgi:hypothetical protein